MKIKSVAVCGKGGVGKTTVSAITTGALSRLKNQKSLIVDADHAGGLAMALGIDVAGSIYEIQKRAMNQAKEEPADKANLSMSIDYFLLNALTEKGNLGFLPLGRPETEGCFCAVNALLRQAVEVLADKFDYMLLDAEAGIEQVNRKVTQGVDYLLLVSDCSAKGLRVAHTIAKVVQKNSEKKPECGILINRVRNPKDIQSIEKKVDLNIVGWIEEDDTIRKYDSEEISFFDLPLCPARNAVEGAMKQIGFLP